MKEDVSKSKGLLIAGEGELLRKLFQAIRHKDFATVQKMLEKTPSLVACVAKQPPKKDDGQSPLQVALKTGNFEIANLLLDLGADVNFMEDENSCNEWRAPVIHDAIMAAVMCCRWNNVMNNVEVEVQSSKAEADEAFSVLRRIIDMGADVNAVDSFGNSCVWRVCLDARQILPRYHYGEKKEEMDRILTPELKEDLGRIFDLLYDHGMDDTYICPGSMAGSVREFFKDESVMQFLRTK